MERYVFFITGGTQLFSITLLSINHYFCVVKNTWYDRVYTTKNMSVNSKMNTIPVWMHGLALYLGMTSYTANSLVYSMLNRKIKYSILNFARNFFPKWNQS
uniref:Uncharacterized protein LOC111132619 n=1 Tax=Crassostrea virginica TaxID=6565 RepID=A0A8B8E7P0_CRAVI|nr:uncharacterized protein LOC111132619 [Crassostrea virginica]